MRLNGRAAVMEYLGIRSRDTLRRYRHRGLTIRMTPTHRMYALTEEIDGWEGPRRPSKWALDANGKFCKPEYAAFSRSSGPVNATAGHVAYSGIAQLTEAQYEASQTIPECSRRDVITNHSVLSYNSETCNCSEYGQMRIWSINYTGSHKMYYVKSGVPTVETEGESDAS